MNSYCAELLEFPVDWELGTFIRFFTRFVFGYRWHCLVGLVPCLCFRLGGSLDKRRNIGLFFLRSRRVVLVKNSNEMVATSTPDIV